LSGFLTPNVGKVLISASDTNKNYLSDKLVEGNSITLTVLNPGANETIRISASGGALSDELIKITTLDTTAGYLNSKISAGAGISKSVLNPSGNEQLQLSFSGIPQENVFYVGKHGSDGYNGLSIDTAFLTFGAALSAVSGESSTNRFSIVCLDAGRYDEQISIDAYVDVFAPNATLAPVAAGTAISLQFDSVVTFKSIVVGDGSFAVVKVDVVGIPPTINAQKIIIGDGSAGVVNLSTSDALIANCEKIYVGDGSFAIGDISTNKGHTHVDVTDIYFQGTNSFGIAMVNSGSIVGKIDHILNHTSGLTGNTGIYCLDGYVDVVANVVDANTCYNVGGGILHLITNRISGTETYTGGYRNIINSGGKIDWENLPTGATGYGIATNRTSDSLSLVGTKLSGVGNKSIIVAADVNAASINASHKPLSVEWINNVNAATELVFINGSGDISLVSDKIRTGNVPAGLSVDYGVYTTTNTDVLSLWSTRADGVGNVSTAIVADVNNATISATHKPLSVQWVNNADAATELVFINGSGDISLVSDKIRTGNVPAGLSADYGVYTTTNTDVLSLWGTRADGSGNISTAIVADVNAASINVAHKPLSVQWVNNADAATELVFINGSGDISLVSDKIRTGNVPAGLSADYGVYTTATTDTLSLWSTRADGASNVSTAIVSDVNAATINAAHKPLSVQWVNNADAATELVFINGSGDISLVSDKIRTGNVPAGLSADYGVYTTATTDTLSLWSTRSNGSGNVSTAIVADVNNATIDNNHRLLELDWVNNSDVKTSSWYFTQSSIGFDAYATIVFKGTQLDGVSSVGVDVGSNLTYSTAGARLLRVLNNTNERVYVSKDGDIAWGKTNNNAFGIDLVNEELVTIAAAVDSYGTFDIPAGSVVYGVTCYVQVAIPGTVSFDIGYIGSNFAWGDDIASTLGTNNDTYAQKNGNIYFAAATKVKIKPNTTPSGATGRVRVAIFYRRLYSPTQ
jgi:hypothetical protein